MHDLGMEMPINFLKKYYCSYQRVIPVNTRETCHFLLYVNTFKCKTRISSYFLQHFSVFPTLFNVLVWIHHFNQIFTILKLLLALFYSPSQTGTFSPSQSCQLRLLILVLFFPIYFSSLILVKQTHNIQSTFVR